MLRAKKRCATPGCTYRNFHNGAHSNELEQHKKKPRTSKCHSRDAFKSPDKSAIRALVAAYAQGVGGRLCYLEHDDAIFTRQLLANRTNHSNLVPVNKDSWSAAAIYKRSGIPCVVDNIFHHVANAGSGAFGVVWFDTMATGYSEALDKLCAAAAIKVWTFNSRNVHGSDQIRQFKRLLYHAGESVHSAGEFSGSGGVRNMITIASSRTKRPVNVGAIHAAEDNLIGLVMRIPVDHWQCIDTAHDYVIDGGSHYVASVIDYARGNQVRLAFACKGGTTVKSQALMPVQQARAYAIGA